VNERPEAKVALAITTNNKVVYVSGGLVNPCAIGQGKPGDMIFVNGR